MSAVVTPAFRVAVCPIRNVRVAGDAGGTGDGSLTIEGYAAVFEQETVLYDGNWFRISEVISRGAFDNVLQRIADGLELVHLNHGHDMVSAVAATDVAGVGALELSADFHGLRFFARVDRDDPDAVRMAVKMRRGVVAQASFAFSIADEELEQRDLPDGREDDLYRILEIKHLYDVCVCAQGAYPQTESYVRSLAAASVRDPLLGALGRSGTGDGDPEGQPRRSSEGEIPAAPETVGPVVTGRAALLRAQAANRNRHLRNGGALR